MKLLSIDVGIKNLALCLINVENMNEYNIEKWVVLNLCNENKKKCEICEKNANYKYLENYYCKKHITNSGKNIISTELEKNKLKKIKLKDLKNILNREKIPFPENESKFVIIEHIHSYLLNNYVIPFNNNIKSTELSLIEIGINMREKLDELFNNIEINTVIIENQISPIANRMKTLQGMLAQYFIMKNIYDIQFISSSNKLKDFDCKKSIYSERKKKGIEVCEEILINNNNFNKELSMFLECKKKDDLADCFLQGMWYLKDKNKIKYN